MNVKKDKYFVLTTLLLIEHCCILEILNIVIHELFLDLSSGAKSFRRRISKICSLKRASVMNTNQNNISTNDM